MDANAAIGIGQVNFNPSAFPSFINLSLRACREAMARAGYPCELPSRAKIFVKPKQYHGVMATLTHVDEELHDHELVNKHSHDFSAEREFDVNKRIYIYTYIYIYIYKNCEGITALQGLGQNFTHLTE